jgi:hypothetical protein
MSFLLALRGKGEPTLSRDQVHPGTELQYDLFTSTMDGISLSLDLLIMFQDFVAS